MNIMNMVTRIILRKVINMGINKGIGLATQANRKRKAGRADPHADEMWDGEEGTPPVRRERKVVRR